MTYLGKDSWVDTLGLDSTSIVKTQVKRLMNLEGISEGFFQIVLASALLQGRPEMTGWHVTLCVHPSGSHFCERRWEKAALWMSAQDMDCLLWTIAPGYSGCHLGRQPASSAFI